MDRYWYKLMAKLPWPGDVAWPGIAVTRLDSWPEEMGNFGLVIIGVRDECWLLVGSLGPSSFYTSLVYDSPTGERLHRKFFLFFFCGRCGRPSEAYRTSSRRDLFLIAKLTLPPYTMHVKVLCLHLRDTSPPLFNLEKVAPCITLLDCW